jgi:hypothetical protein
MRTTTVQIERFDRAAYPTPMVEHKPFIVHFRFSVINMLPICGDEISSSFSGTEQDLHGLILIIKHLLVNVRERGKRFCFARLTVSVSV